MLRLANRNRFPYLFLFGILLVFCAPAVPQSDIDESDIVRRVGPGITPPEPTERREPEYTDAARDAQIQGTVVFSVVVDRKGFLRDIEVMSPLGFGLDETAIEALKSWRFRPATKDGEPVNVEAIIEVNFRLLDYYFDKKREARRTRYNLAIRNLSRSPKNAAKSVETLKELAPQLPAAMYAYAILLEEGKLLPRDEAKAVELFRTAAEKDHPEAMTRVALMQLRDDPSAASRDEALKLLKDASVLGSLQAQRWLGLQYLSGQIVPRDKARAERQFRLCAARGVWECQFDLGRSLLGGSNGLEDSGLREHLYLQALAWLELAAEGGLKVAEDFAKPHQDQLTTEQRKQVNRLKRQLLQPGN